MKYNNIKKALFQKRLNRFVAEILIDDEIKLCHVKNTGRCAELLIKNTVVYVEACANKDRKTPFTLIAVDKNGNLTATNGNIGKRSKEF